jgi:formylglycine-generating enzyme required for sulfatase activity/uncharacterized caspase-like protein
MGKNYAVTIGINQYQNLRPLKYAQRDASAMRNFFLTELKFEKVYYFAEGSPKIPSEYGPPLPSEPTFGNLDRFLDVRFEQPFLESGDNLWFFFAGHGRRSGGRDYLMPLDSSPKRLERTAIAIRDIADRLRRSGADNVVLMIDACRGEDDRDGGEGIGREVQQGIITLFSCSPNELSYEIDELQQGVFTHALLEGLRIQGEGNCATVERLYQHLQHQVPRLNQRHNKPSQTPYAITEPATKLHLILIPQQATLQDVMALKNDALEAEAENDLDLAEQLWIRVLVASSADRQAINALQRVALRRALVPTNSQMQKPELIPQSSRMADGSARLERPANSESSVEFEFEVVTVDAKGHEIKRESKRIQGWTEGLGNGIGLEMVSIPSGSFQMGSPPTEGQRYEDESPQHPVTVPAFWMGKYTITQAQWKIVASWEKVEKDLNLDPSKFKGTNRPVESISWDDAVEFCARLSKQLGREYRLPSEAEWEYACRGGTETPFHFGETITPELANYNGSYTYGKGPKGVYRKQTTEVGSFKVANAYGLYDMHGNVWEWCQDQWHSTYEGAPTDGSAWVTEGDASSRVLRGGSWVYNPRNCRSAGRPWYDYGRYDGVGLRVVCVSTRT